MKKLTDLSTPVRTSSSHFWPVLSYAIFAFLVLGFYLYKPGKATLLNDLTGCVLLLGWLLLLLAVLRTPRQASPSTRATDGDIRENPWEAMKSFAKVAFGMAFCGGMIYSGATAFWRNKVLYWPGGRGKPSLYVFWSDSAILAFAMALTWLLLGLITGFALLRSYWLADDLAK